MAKRVRDEVKFGRWAVAFALELDRASDITVIAL